MDTINNGVRAFDLPAGATLTMRQASPGSTALAALASSDGATGFSSSALTSSVAVTIGPFTANARINVMAQGTVSVDSATGTGGGSTTWAALTDKATANLPVDNTALATALAAKATAGLATLNPTAVTVSRAITAADFGAGILPINAAGVVAITMPTVAAMGVAATAGSVRMLAVEVLGGGIPTFAGATASTIINGTAGPTTVLPLGGAPVTNGIYVLTQQAVGSDAWSLS